MLNDLVGLSLVYQRSMGPTISQFTPQKYADDSTHTPSSKPGPTLKSLTFSASAWANLSYIPSLHGSALSHSGSCHADSLHIYPVGYIISLVHEGV